MWCCFFYVNTIVTYIFLDVLDHDDVDDDHDDFIDDDDDQHHHHHHHGGDGSGIIIIAQICANLTTY